MEREAVEVGFRGLQRGDIAHDALERDQLAELPNLHDPVLGVDDRAVASRHPDHERVGGVLEIGEVRARRLDVVGVHELEHEPGVSVEVVARVPEDLGDRRVDVLEPERRETDAVDHVGRVLGEVPEPLLRRSDRVLGRSLLGDVDEGADHADRLVRVSVPQLVRAAEHPRDPVATRGTCADDHVGERLAGLEGLDRRECPSGRGACRLRRGSPGRFGTDRRSRPTRSGSRALSRARRLAVCTLPSRSSTTTPTPSESSSASNFRCASASALIAPHPPGTIRTGRGRGEPSARSRVPPSPCTSTSTSPSRWSAASTSPRS